MKLSRHGASGFRLQCKQPSHHFENLPAHEPCLQTGYGRPASQPLTFRTQVSSSVDLTLLSTAFAWRSVVPFLFGPDGGALSFSESNLEMHRLDGSAACQVAGPLRHTRRVQGQEVEPRTPLHVCKIIVWTSPVEVDSSPFLQGIEPEVVAGSLRAASTLPGGLPQRPPRLHCS